MDKISKIFVGDAVELTDEQKTFLQINNGQVVYNALSSKLKNREINVRTFSAACKYHLESTGHQYAPGIGWVKSSDLPRMGIKEGADGWWGVIIYEKVTTESIRIGREVKMVTRTTTEIPYDGYLKDQDKLRSMVSVRQLEMLREVNDVLGVE